ncbi:MAG: DUF2087 domain-containing protein [Defluviitaleaceae bacterium]|nr:DUF2087 domain-containing protein [Defluviitaleaceae bacterium]
MELHPALPLFRALSDSTRLHIIKSLCKEPMYVAQLAERLALSPPVVSGHLKKLEEIGAVWAWREQYYVTYTLNKNMFNPRVIDLILSEPVKPPAADEAATDIKAAQLAGVIHAAQSPAASPAALSIEDAREAAARAKVIATFMPNNKITQMPAQLKKKLILIEEIAKAFESNKPYTEKEMNLTIADYYDDFCMVRRFMVDYRLFKRDGAGYMKIDSSTGKDEPRTF